MALQQSTCNITVNSNVSIQRAINIQKVQSGISSSLILNSKIINIQKSNSSILIASSLTIIGYKSSFIKLGINSYSDITMANNKIYSTLKCSINSKAKFECYRYNRDIQLSLKEYIPPLLRDINAFSRIIRIQGNEITKYNAILDDLLMQYFIDTATWGLEELWEKELGISTNLALTYEERRKRIKFRLQLKNITITKKVFKSVMDEYYSCNIDEDFINSKVNITVIGIRGIPPRISEMTADAEELLPCHLDYGFIYTYLPWNELEVSDVTWNQIDAYTWDEFETAFLV